MPSLTEAQCDKLYEDGWEIMYETNHNPEASDEKLLQCIQIALTVFGNRSY